MYGSTQTYAVETSTTSMNRSDLRSYLKKYVNYKSNSWSEITTSDPGEVEGLREDGVNQIINHCRVNDLRYINKFFETVNKTLPDQGYFICCFESLDHRRDRILRKHHPIISYPHYFLDFWAKRVLPKIPILNKVYFSITKGQKRVLSLSETLGRLISCGFDIVDHQTFGNLTYVVSVKKGDPVYDQHPTYGLLIRLERVGKDGKLITVYKVRTMHPYSEYLQSYIYKTNELKDGGKFNNDFRVTSYGRVFRKWWIDELPMLINLLKGELKLVGVRPLSQHYFSLYPKHFQDIRIKHRPGLVPPFYADMPVTFDEILASEMRYLQAYEKAPIRTDLRYFFKSFYNIFFKGARSA